MPAWSRSSSRHSTTSASLPTSSVPSSSSRPRQRAPCSVPSSSASPHVIAAGPPAQPRDQQRLAQLAAELAGLVGRRAVDAEPDRRARPQQRHHRRDPGAQPRVGGRAVGDARARLPEARDLVLVEVHAVREPDVVAEPADSSSRYSTGRAPEHLEAERLLLDRLGHVRVQPHAARAGVAPRVSAISSRVTLNGEHGASAIRHIEPGEASWNSFSAAVVGGEDRVAVLARRCPAAARRRTGQGPSSRGTG